MTDSFSDVIIFYFFNKSNNIIEENQYIEFFVKLFH